MVDYAKPAPPFPESCSLLANRILDSTSALTESTDVIDLKSEDGKLPPLNQLTINEYLPGQGIASHTGTKILSLLVILNCRAIKFLLVFRYGNLLRIHDLCSQHWKWNRDEYYKKHW